MSPVAVRVTPEFDRQRVIDTLVGLDLKATPVEKLSEALHIGLRRYNDLDDQALAEDLWVRVGDPKNGNQGKLWPERFGIQIESKETEQHGGGGLDKIDAFRRALEVVQQDVSPELTINQLLMLIHVARAGRVDQGVAGAACGMSSAAISRNASTLAENGPMNRNGRYGLVNVATDSGDRRKRLMYLTPKGKALIRRMQALMEG